MNKKLILMHKFRLLAIWLYHVVATKNDFGGADLSWLSRYAIAVSSFVPIGGIACDGFFRDTPSWVEGHLLESSSLKSKLFQKLGISGSHPETPQWQTALSGKAYERKKSRFLKENRREKERSGFLSLYDALVQASGETEWEERDNFFRFLSGLGQVDHILPAFYHPFDGTHEVAISILKWSLGPSAKRSIYIVRVTSIQKGPRDIPIYRGGLHLIIPGQSDADFEASLREERGFTANLGNIDERVSGWIGNRRSTFVAHLAIRDESRFQGTGFIRHMILHIPAIGYKYGTSSGFGATSHARDIGYRLAVMIYRMSGKRFESAPGQNGKSE